MALPDTRKLSELIADPNTVLVVLAGVDYFMVYDTSESIDTRKVKVITKTNALGQFTVPMMFGDGVNVITTSPAIQGIVRLPVACSVASWEIVADVEGSIVVDVWKAPYADLPATNADSIAGSEKITLSDAQKNQDLALDTWTTQCLAGDYLYFEVESAATIKFAALTLIMNRD